MHFKFIEAKKGRSPNSWGIFQSKIWSKPWPHTMFADVSWFVSSFKSILFWFVFMCTCKNAHFEEPDLMYVCLWTKCINPRDMRKYSCLALEHFDLCLSRVTWIWGLVFRKQKMPLKDVTSAKDTANIWKLEKLYFRTQWCFGAISAQHKTLLILLW